jgi:hypothetical protein
MPPFLIFCSPHVRLSHTPISHPAEVDPELRESLSSLAVYLADAERMLQATDPTSTTTSYRRIYVDVRSKMLVEEVTNLASQSSIVDTSDRASYDRGSSDFIPFTHTVLSLLQVGPVSGCVCVCVA